MTRFVWTGDRFAWSFVTVIVFATISLLLLDFAWRSLVVPFESFVLGALAVEITGALLCAGLYRLLRRRF